MFRRRRSIRYGLVLMLVGCGAAAPEPRTVARAEPLPASENQQGRQETIADEPARDPDPLPSELPSIAGVYLWCQAPTGRACTLASAILGTGPKDPSGLPQSLLAVEDRSNDCDEPTITTLSARLAMAFAVDRTGWRDQGGSSLDMSTLGDMYQAAGCINDVNPSLPIAKISAADGAMPRVYLVRVWDAQPPTY